MTYLARLAVRFEQASERYAASNGITRTPEWFGLNMQEELGELIQVWMKLRGHGRRTGMSEMELAEALSDETADLLGQVMLFAHQNQINLPDAIERKWRFRPE